MTTWKPRDTDVASDVVAEVPPDVAAGAPVDDVVGAVTRARGTGVGGEQGGSGEEDREASGGEGVLGRTYRALSIGVVSVVFLIAFEATAVSTAMPVAARELHGVGLYALAFSAYFTTSLFAMVLAGQWADRHGPLAPLAAGICAFAVGLVVAGTASTMWLFIAGRAVQGLGGGLDIVALYVVVGRAYPERLRPVMIAAFSAGWVVPSIVGPLASGAITENVGWRWVFLGIPVLIVLPLVLALPATRRMASGRADPSAPAPEFDRHRILLAACLSAGAALLEYASENPRWLSLLPLAAGLALLVPAIRGLLPHGTWYAARGLPAVVALRGVCAGSFVAAESFVPLMLVTERGLSATLAGLSIACGGLTWSIGSYVQARPGLEPYRKPLTTTGMVMVVLAVAGAPTVLLGGVPVWIVALAWGIGCTGMGIVISSTSVVLFTLSSPEKVGTNTGALQIADSLSNVLMLAVGGAAFSALGGGAVGAVTGTGDGAAGAGAGSHAEAFGAVFVTMAVVSALGIWVSRRIRTTREA
jgi:MFS family permease